MDMLEIEPKIESLNSVCYALLLRACAPMRQCVCALLANVSESEDLIQCRDYSIITAVTCLNYM